MCSRLRIANLLFRIRPTSASYCSAELPRRSESRIRLDLSPTRSEAAIAMTWTPRAMAISFSPWVRKVVASVSSSRLLSRTGIFCR